MPSDSDSRPAAPGSETTHLHEERLRLAVEATGLGTWDLDPLTGALHWDERCKALFGLSPDASVDYGTFLSLVHPEDREHLHQVVQQALDPTGNGSYRLDYRSVSPRDGTVRWLSTSGRAFFDSTGRAVRFLGTVLDITERVLEREAAEREKHRVTTLLEHISEAFEAFDRDWRYIYVNREAERLLGRPREELLGRTHWEVYPDTGEWDPDRLAQVVSNLVGNALQHGAHDTPVEVRLGHEDSTLVLTVHNQGTPIPEALLPHVFDPFRRADNRSRQGLGLGLYIVQQLILAHGGTITVSSQVDSGTTFTVRLPRHAPSP
jgi:PAS domain S-box-containing protein